MNDQPRKIEDIQAMAKQFAVDVDKVVADFEAEIAEASEAKDVGKLAKDIAYKAGLITKSLELAGDEGKAFAELHSAKLNPIIKSVKYFQDLVVEYDRTKGDSLADQVRFLGQFGALDNADELIENWAKTGPYYRSKSDENAEANPANEPDFDFALRVRRLSDDVILGREGDRTGKSRFSSLISKVQNTLRDETGDKDYKLSPVIRKAFRDAKSHFEKENAFNPYQVGDYVVERWDTKTLKAIHSAPVVEVSPNADSDNESEHSAA